MIPACRIPPPHIFRNRLARWMTARLPASALPTGAPRPFENATLTVSNGAASSLTESPLAALAFQMRAPSRCAASPAACAAAPRAIDAFSESTLPPPRLCVFSIVTSEVRG